MADHFSGPRAIADPASDICDVYAFPSPERPGNLVLVLNVLPASAPTALFSDAITHRFRVRPITSVSEGAAAAFNVEEDEYVFDFTFDAPQKVGGTDTLVQAGTCQAPGGRKVSFQVGNEVPTEAEGLKIFAGSRLDPFFIDFVGVIATEATGKLAFRSDASNVLEGLNALSIVLEIDAAVLGPAAGSLVAVVGETLTPGGGRPVRLERMGRPEIKNVIMSPKKFDTVNSDLEIRDLINEEDAFSLRPDYASTYRARLNANLAFYDGLDGKTAWPLDEQGAHPLTELLLADFLVVDLSKPFSEDGCFEIETALLAGRPHTTCGGRSLNDDIVDTLYTLLVGGIDGERISDGVDQPTQLATDAFPYLNAPNPTPPDLGARLAAQMPPREEAA
ncbi:DUF4331 domain-containing protein [Streptomyces sp. NBC_01728]|uniref:DUF4331 family protein n=1 Tax=unclassified Streptomyces TaxID=2593676 RepID=UPI00224F7F12|nr:MULTISPECIES: DUF4331 family protein [unclassified Streptomyces]MCX4460822.1 DUF4331 domain-containing protein [Streptomyces sp. NBC_01719]MCX4499848.1 DUF4331 domain-containing protein [Streptomyces sp. NBC_01728]